MMKKPTLRQIITIGFTMFAIYFGAGNLIFPPTLGFQSGSQWWIVLLGFAVTDVGLSVLGVIAIAKAGGTVESMMKAFGYRFSVLIGVAVSLCIGPLFCIPRTAATTYEMAVAPFLPGGGSLMSSWLVAALFFLITALLTLSKSHLVDIVGKYLTPGILIVLGVVIILAIVNPPGELAYKEISHGFGNGFREGYQTMDAIGSILVGALLISDVVQKGFRSKAEQLYTIRRAGLVAGICLVFIYGGLCYVGATCSTLFPEDVTRVELLAGAVNHILGPYARVAVGIAVALACLTTSIGLTSMVSDYFSHVTGGRISYRAFVIIICVFSTFMAILGVETIVNLAINILIILYPVLMVIILMNLIDQWIPRKTAYLGAVGAAFVVSLCEVLGQKIPALGNLVNQLPLHADGFAWLLPSILCAIIFTLIGAANNDKWAKHRH